MSTSIKLKNGEVTLAWTNRAQYRLGSLSNAPDLSNPQQFYSGICAWVWAMLPKHVAKRYASPEDIAEEIDIDNLEGISEAVSAAIEEANMDKEGSVKNDKPGKKRKSASKPG